MGLVTLFRVAVGSYRASGSIVVLACTVIAPRRPQLDVVPFLKLVDNFLQSGKLCVLSFGGKL